MRTKLVGAMAIVGLGCAVAPLAEGNSADCKAGPGMLGVSRVVEIDTSSGPRFGRQYRDQVLLRDKEVVLTFDDGPLRPYTRPVLDALAAHCTKATFFMVGRMAIADPEMARSVLKDVNAIATAIEQHSKKPA